MSLSKKKLFWLAVGIQIVILIAMVIQREHLLRSDQTILLELVPKDPRSLLSGDYVILSYKVGQLNKTYSQYDESFERGDIVYLAVRKNANTKFWDAVKMAKDMVNLSTDFPNDVIIRGKITNVWNETNYIIEYGIESYFVPQKKGLKIEYTSREDISVEIKVSRITGECAINRLLIKDKPVNFDNE